MRILIIRPDRIGDVVLSTPLPREIKKKYPHAYIAVLARNYTKDIFLNNPFINEIIVMEENRGIKEFLKDLLKIKAGAFDVALSLLPTKRINWALFFAGIKLRIGVGHKFYQFMTNTKSVYRYKYNPLRHEADYCMDLARKIGVQTENIASEIYLSKDEIEEVTRIKASHNPGNKIFIGAHATSGNSAPNWNEDKYYELITAIARDERFRIAITDNQIPEKLKNMDNVVYRDKLNGLRDLIKFIASLDYLISASTGPLHIAAALKVKTISLFCPMTACSPKLWGPKGNISRVIIPEESYCAANCPGDPKKCNYENGGIDHEIVLKELEEFVKLNL